METQARMIWFQYFQQQELKINHKNINDSIIKDFDNSLHEVLLNLAKRVVADGEGASKFVTIKVNSAKTREDAKKICFFNC